MAHEHTKAMHEKHHKEHRDMNTRQEREMKEMHERHEAELAGGTDEEAADEEASKTAGRGQEKDDVVGKSGTEPGPK